MNSRQSLTIPEEKESGIKLPAFPEASQKKSSSGYILGELGPDGGGENHSC